MSEGRITYFVRDKTIGARKEREHTPENSQKEDFVVAGEMEIF